MTKRIANDFYPTRESGKLVPILKECVDFADSIVLDPCAGDGEIIKHFNKSLSADLYRYPNFTADKYSDMSKSKNYLDLPPFDWVVTNPPYRLATPIIKASFGQARIGGAFLLRLSYLEPTEDRAKWLINNQRFMSHLVICNPRPRYRADKPNQTDSVTSAWVVWDKRYTGATRVIYATNWR